VWKHGALVAAVVDTGVGRIGWADVGRIDGRTSAALVDTLLRFTGASEEDMHSFRNEFYGQN
jgi:hypothetical protein